jgi:hypothetical protein
MVILAAGTRGAEGLFPIRFRTFWVRKTAGQRSVSEFCYWLTDRELRPRPNPRLWSKLHYALIIHRIAESFFRHLIVYVAPSILPRFFAILSK